MADPAYIVNGTLTDGEAWVGIAHASLSLPAATVTWTSTDDGQTGDFSQYMDLVVVSYARSDRNGAEVNDRMGVQFNNDTTSSYTSQWLSGDGSAASASYLTLTTYGNLGMAPAAAATANIFGAFVTHIFDINSGKYKSMITSAAADRDGAGDTGLFTVTWRKPAPISEIDLVLPQTGADFVAGSSFSLFGVMPRMVA